MSIGREQNSTQYIYNASRGGEWYHRELWMIIETGSLTLWFSSLSVMGSSGANTLRNLTQATLFIWNEPMEIVCLLDFVLGGYSNNYLWVLNQL